MIQLKADRPFSPDFNQIVDCRAISKMELTNEQVIELAERSVFGAGSRRAFVVSSELQYGLSRMFATYREMKRGQQVMVFRDLRDAYSWLSLSPDQAPHLAPAPGGLPGLT